MWLARSLLHASINRGHRKQKTMFKIKWIIDLIRQQKPDRTDLIAALKKVNPTQWERQPYIYFVSASRPNEPDSEWQFQENVVLEHPVEGTIVLDILRDGRIGGIEFINQIPDH